MSSLTRSDVLRISTLAKINLSDSEILLLQKQLSKIIEYIGHLQEIDTSGVEPTSQTTNLTNITRLDKIKSESCLTQEESLIGSKSTYNGFFKVPIIIDK